MPQHRRDSAALLRCATSCVGSGRTKCGRALQDLKERSARCLLAKAIRAQRNMRGVRCGRLKVKPKSSALLCGITLELSGRCRDELRSYTVPTRSGPLERIVSHRARMQLQEGE